jgi:hypothetical protein
MDHISLKMIAGRQKKIGMSNLPRRNNSTPISKFQIRRSRRTDFEICEPSNVPRRHALVHPVPAPRPAWEAGRDAGWTQPCVGVPACREDGGVSPAGLIRDLNESRFRFRAGVSRIVLRDRRHRLPNVVYQPKNLAVIAKRVKIAGISGDLNNGPCHAISLGRRRSPDSGPDRRREAAAVYRNSSP